MKTTLDLLLIRITENATGETWRTLRWELERLRLGRFSGPAGEVHQRTETTARQATIFKALAVAEPPRFVHLDPPSWPHPDPYPLRCRSRSINTHVGSSCGTSARGRVSARSRTVTMRTCSALTRLLP
ncbi:MAG: hypothetical protein GEU73_00075 [Chloroflexi bacterium]|nr:hypothetical protein [Chloroflexota bacterium]